MKRVAFLVATWAGVAGAQAPATTTPIPAPVPSSEAPKPALVRTAEAKAADAGAEAPPEPENVVVRFVSNVRGARVFWGKKVLCETPCSITRPRDSGPLDVVIRAGGYLPLHTRGFTFEDYTVSARLTPTSARHTLFGHKFDPDATETAEPTNH
jgi:hypothetical protein